MTTKTSTPAWPTCSPTTNRSFGVRRFPDPSQKHHGTLASSPQLQHSSPLLTAPIHTALPTVEPMYRSSAPKPSTLSAFLNNRGRPPSQSPSATTLRHNAPTTPTLAQSSVTSPSSHPPPIPCYQYRTSSSEDSKSDSTPTSQLEFSTRENYCSKDANTKQPGSSNLTNANSSDPLHRPIQPWQQRNNSSSTRAS